MSTPIKYPVHKNYAVEARSHLEYLIGDYHFWSKLTGITVLDPDGWDRSGEWDKEVITLAEFMFRCNHSTAALQLQRMNDLQGLLKYPTHETC